MARTLILASSLLAVGAVAAASLADVRPATAQEVRGDDDTKREDEKGRKITVWVLEAAGKG